MLMFMIREKTFLFRVHTFTCLKINSNNVIAPEMRTVFSAN